MSTPSSLDSGGLGPILGPRLRERRTELGKTLAEVAGAAEVSSGYLSAIENATSVPSLPVLARIAHALEVSLAEILRSSGSAHRARGHIADGDGTSELAAEGSQLQIVRHAASPGESGDAPLDLGRGDVFIFLCEGQLEVTLHDGVFELARGDALHCDRPRSVTWRATGDESAVALWVAPSR